MLQSQLSEWLLSSSLSTPHPQDSSYPDGIRTEWVCSSCEAPYDREFIEQTLVIIIEQASMRYQVQDLECQKTREVKTTKLADFSPYSGRYQNTETREEFLQQ